ncbi:MAG TPA: DUF389 domain-containing protein [Trebonia sp.]|jgi:uncharacterized hydrophobic protein (TIGR00271 family)|nr:DUF389 domain-containing protein [Trebonia sp.]
MLHVRVVSPPALTGHLTGELQVIPGVQNVIVQAGGAVRPPGDAVQFDVRDEAANPTLAALRDLGLDQSGAICVERVDAALTGPRFMPPGGGVLRRETPPVWEMVEAAVRAGQVYAPSFYALLVAAGLLAAVGLLTNSQVLIVGAMVVGPEYNAIIAVALAITRRDHRTARDGLLALLWGFLAVVAVTILFGLAVRWSGTTPAPFLADVRPVGDFINSPDMFSLIVAVLAGIVGVVSLTEARANALIGVFISVTTIPAAASIGVSIAYSSWTEAWGSAVQLLLNVFVLVVVGAAGLTAQHGIWRWHERRRLARLRLRRAPTMLVTNMLVTNIGRPRCGTGDGREAGAGGCWA